jgi:hypothetical protein
MNGRQAKKLLKKQIKSLKSDNDLMKRIITDHAGMAELYNLYNRPCNVTYSTMSLQEYRVRRTIPRYMADLEDYTEHVRHALVRDLTEAITKDIQFEPVEICGERAIEASIYVGRK